jgi:hypothetical protein
MVWRKTLSAPSHCTPPTTPHTPRRARARTLRPKHRAPPPAHGGTPRHGFAAQARGLDGRKLWQRLWAAHAQKERAQRATDGLHGEGGVRGGQRLQRRSADDAGRRLSQLMCVCVCV